MGASSLPPACAGCLAHSALPCAPVAAEFDAVIGGVLDRDPVAEVMVFYEPDQELWLERTRQRLFSHPHVVRLPLCWAGRTVLRVVCSRVCATHVAAGSGRQLPTSALRPPATPRRAAGSGRVCRGCTQSLPSRYRPLGPGAVRWPRVQRLRRGCLPLPWRVFSYDLRAAGGGCTELTRARYAWAYTHAQDGAICSSHLVCAPVCAAQHSGSCGSTPGCDGARCFVGV